LKDLANLSDSEEDENQIEANAAKNVDGKDQLEKDLLDEFDPSNNNHELQAIIDSRKPN